MDDFIRARGTRLVSGPAEDDIFLRGVAIDKSEPGQPAPERYAELAGLGVNTVRLSFSYRDFYDAAAPGAFKETAWRWIDAHLALARRSGMRLILQCGAVEGAQFVPIAGAPFDYRIWTSSALQERFAGLWHAIAGRYCREPQIAGYDLFCEPVVAETKAQWHALARRAIEAIRTVDAAHLIFVDRVYGEHAVRREVSGVDLAPEDAFVAVDDDNVVYEFYFFERDEYTHQFAPWRADVQAERVYPDAQWQIRYREAGGLARDLPFGRDYLEFYLSRQLEFGRAHGAPMAAWGFGALKTCFANDRGGLRWLSDVLALYNAAGLHWTLWGYGDPHFGIDDNAAAKAVLQAALAPCREVKGK